MNKSNLGYFVNLYVDTALKIAKKPILSERFDSHIRENLFKKLKISIQDICLLHHPFHWAFFLDKKNSPFEYSVDKEGKGIITLKKEISSKTKQKMAEYILKEYGSLLEGKLEALNS